MTSFELLIAVVQCLELAVDVTDNARASCCLGVRVGEQGDRRPSGGEVDMRVDLLDVKRTLDKGVDRSSGVSLACVGREYKRVGERCRAKVGYRKVS